MSAFCSANNTAPLEVDRVFVLSNRWDFNFGHFLTDSLARLARHVKFLRENRDVLVHLRFFELYDNEHAELQPHRRPDRELMRYGHLQTSCPMS